MWQQVTRILCVNILIGEGIIYLCTPGFDFITLASGFSGEFC